MKCPGCESDNPDSTSSGTSCGRPLSAAPTQVSRALRGRSRTPCCRRAGGAGRQLHVLCARYKLPRPSMSRVVFTVSSEP